MDLLVSRNLNKTLAAMSKAQVLECRYDKSLYWVSVLPQKRFLCSLVAKSFGGS